MSDQTTRVLATLRGAYSRFCGFNIPTGSLTLNYPALAEVVTEILREQEAADLRALADRLDCLPDDERYWSLDRTLGWSIGHDSVIEALRAEAARLTGPAPVSGGAR